MARLEELTIWALGLFCVLAFWMLLTVGIITVVGWALH